MKWATAQRKAKRYDSQLKATDTRFGHSVHLISEDGSCFHWRYAFIMRHKNYYFVFTEHHSFHIYPKDSVWSIEGHFYSWPKTDK